MYLHNAVGRFGSVPMAVTGEANWLQRAQRCPVTLRLQACLRARRRPSTTQSPACWPRLYAGDMDLHPLTGQYRLSATVPGVEANQLRATLGVRPTPFPVAGAVMGTLHVTGPLEKPIFSGTAMASGWPAAQRVQRGRLRPSPACPCPDGWLGAPHRERRLCGQPPTCWRTASRLLPWLHWSLSRLRWAHTTGSPSHQVRRLPALLLAPVPVPLARRSPPLQLSTSQPHPLAAGAVFTLDTSTEMMTLHSMHAQPVGGGQVSTALPAWQQLWGRQLGARAPS